MTDPTPRPAWRLLVAWRPGYSRDEAIELAAWLARTTDVRIRTIITFLRPWPATSLQKLGGKYGKWLRKEAKAATAATIAAFERAEIPPTAWDEDPAHFVDGPSEHALLTDEVERFDADLLILGSDAAAPKGRFLAGSIADSMLHSSPKPLALAPRAVKLSKRGVRRINFAYLNSEYEGQDAALSYAARLAAEWNLPLRLLAFSPSGISNSSLEDNKDLSKALHHDWREASLAVLDRSRDWIAERFEGLELETDVATGNGWGGAVESLKWKKGDLLCLGSNPVGPIERVFVGSAATELLPHLGVPVIIVPVPRIY